VPAVDIQAARPDSPAVRVLVIGAGAVGGYFAALLLRAGRDVTLVARGEHARSIRAAGLRVIGREGEFSVSPPVVERLDEARDFDLAIVAVKAFALPEVAAALPEALAANGSAMSLCNGLDAEDILAGTLSRARVAGATALIGAERIAPGVVRHDARGIVVVGEAWPPGHGQAARVADFLEASGVPVRRDEDLAKAKWWKMAWNCAFNPLTAAEGCTVGRVMADAELRGVARGAAAEVAAVARASGVELGPDITDRLLSQNADLHEIRTSMLQDVEARRPTENEDLSGAIVRRGRALGVPVPVNAALYRRVLAREAAYGPANGS
jgi:2-dehydropantoate 2-reductase